MDRRAVILNLRDLRDLEFAKVYLTQKRNEDWYAYQREIDNLSTTHYAEIQTEEGNAIGSIIFSTFGLIIGGIIVIASLMNMGSGDGWPPIINIIVAILSSPTLAIIGIIIGVPIVGFSGFALMGSLQQNNENAEKKINNEKAIQHNKAEDARITKNQPQITQLQQSQQERDDYWNNELQKVDDLLDEAYAVNLVPMPYRRKLAAIQYIYEFMSSSSVSLEHALLSTQIEDGIRRIEAKLDIIISQQNEMIFQMHRQEAQSRQLMSQNEQMLASLHRTETNTLEAAQYAQLSASYNKTCAFFALANYLDK